MVITIWLRNGEPFDVEAENKEVGYLAEQAATQTDEHRDKRWTLSFNGQLLDPWLSAEAAGLEDGSEVDVVEYEPPKPGLFKRALNALGVTS